MVGGRGREREVLSAKVADARAAIVSTLPMLPFDVAMRIERSGKGRMKSAKKKPSPEPGST